MNRYTQSKENLTAEQVRANVKSYACFSSVYGDQGGFCYYQIKKYLPEKINKWLLALAATLFDFEILHEDKEDIIIKLKIEKSHSSNLAKLTLFRYIDQNEKSNVDLEPTINSAFVLKDKYGDFHGFIMGNLIGGHCIYGHSICETINCLDVKHKRNRTPILISFAECKKRIHSGEHSVFRSYTDKEVPFTWTNEEDYWKIVSGNLK